METMPFGRYKGRPLSEVPLDYLEWLLTINLYASTRFAVEEEIKRRKQHQQYTPPRPPRSKDVDATLVAEMLRAGYRALALKWHPDKGGDTRRMQELNTAMDELRRAGKA